jgi:hypothetical protein
MQYGNKFLEILENITKQFSLKMDLVKALTIGVNQN